VKSSLATFCWERRAKPALKSLLGNCASARWQVRDTPMESRPIRTPVQRRSRSRLLVQSTSGVVLAKRLQVVLRNRSGYSCAIRDWCTTTHLFLTMRVALPVLSRVSSAGRTCNPCKQGRGFSTIYKMDHFVEKSGGMNNSPGLLFKFESLAAHRTMRSACQRRFRRISLRRHFEPKGQFCLSAHSGNGALQPKSIVKK
jgi:hypothetical protein